MSDDLRSLMLAIQHGNERQLLADRLMLRIGPFLAAFHPTDALVWLNYATPTDATDGRVTPAYLAEIRAAFATRGRTFRFEFIEALHLRLAATLASAGLTLQLRAPLMALGCDGFRPITASNVSIIDVRSDSDDTLVAAFLRTVRRAFDAELTDVTQAEIAEQRESLRSKRQRVAVALIGEQVAAGAAIALVSGELGGVGTVPEHRRRGAAAAVSSHLIARQFADGAKVVWLSAGTEAARSLYAKLGFADAGAVLNYIDVAAQSE